MSLPRFHWDISAGQALNAILITVGGLWVAFGFFGNISAQSERMDAGARAREMALEQRIITMIADQAQRTALLDQAMKGREAESSTWRNDVREQLRGMNTRLDINNQTLTDIKLGMANKVDRKP
jgi:hypothetical protein